MWRWRSVSHPDYIYSRISKGEFDCFVRYESVKYTALQKVMFVWFRVRTKLGAVALERVQRAVCFVVAGSHGEPIAQCVQSRKSFCCDEEFSVTRRFSGDL